MLEKIVLFYSTKLVIFKLGYQNCNTYIKDVMQRWVGYEYKVLVAIMFFDA